MPFDVHTVVPVGKASEPPVLNEIVSFADPKRPSVDLNDAALLIMYLVLTVALV